MFSKIALVLMVLMFTYDCEGRRNRRPNHRHRHQHGDSRLSRKERAFSQAANDFGISLYKKLVEGNNNNNNLAFAPVGALTTMSMVMLGAVGDTEQNLFQGLKLQPLRRSRKVHRAFKRYTRSINGPLQNATFTSGNAIYVNPEIAVNRRFTRNIRRFYEGQSRNFDFTDPDGPEAPINEWIETKTRGMIQDFLSDGAIGADTVMWLVNAVFFNGTWATTFDERMTSQRNFAVSSNQHVRVNMMNNDYNYATKYNSDLQVRVLELPYAGDRFSFFILLPDSVGLTNLESRISYTTLEGLVTNLDNPSRYMISVPKFRLESSLNLKAPLQAMGITNVFERNFANLSRINSERVLWADKVKQKVVLEVTEYGTIAAAATAVRIVTESLPPQITVDRPFVYVLRDKSTATNLFIGRVVNPAETE